MTTSKRSGGRVRSPLNSIILLQDLFTLTDLMDMILYCLHHYSPPSPIKKQLMKAFLSVLIGMHH